MFFEFEPKFLKVLLLEDVTDAFRAFIFFKVKRHNIFETGDFFCFRNLFKSFFLQLFFFYKILQNKLFSNQTSLQVSIKTPNRCDKHLFGSTEALAE
jgi:hypothetical protein